MQSILPEQQLLEDSAKQEAVLAYLPDPNMRDRLRNRWSHLPEIGQDISVARWQQLEREADKVGKLWRISCWGHCCVLGTAYGLLEARQLHVCSAARSHQQDSCRAGLQARAGQPIMCSQILATFCAGQRMPTC